MRRKDRAITDPDSIRDIVEQARILHLGMLDGAWPYVLPLHFGYDCTDGRFTFYLHCAREGHKLDLIRRDPHVCVELECGVAMISGGDIPCRYGSEYASIVGRGTAEIVSEGSRKIHALEKLMEHQTGRSFVLDEAMAASVEVIAVTVTELTAKANRPT